MPSYIRPFNTQHSQYRDPCFLYFPCFKTSRLGTRRRIQGPARHLTWSVFVKMGKGFQPSAIFAICSVLDVWWGLECTTGYTVLSVERLWLFFLSCLACTSTHRQRHLFTFSGFICSISIVTCSAQSCATTHHICVPYRFWAVNFCLSSVWG